MEIRSFLAFELPVNIKKTVLKIAGEIRDSDLEVRWVKVENIHLTMVFLGNVTREGIEGIQEEVKNVCSEYGSFDIALKRMGCCPNRRRPRILWLGLEGDIERMAHFRNGLQRALIAFGIKEEKRPFKPHLTLGRFRSSRMRGAPAPKARAPDSSSTSAAARSSCRAMPSSGRSATAASARGTVEPGSKGLSEARKSSAAAVGGR